MGYEIPGAMGAKLADPAREVFVFLGDGTYLMAPSEIATSVQEGIKIVIVLVDNGGFASIGSLSRSLGQGGFWNALSHARCEERAAGRRGDKGGFCGERAQFGRACDHGGDIGRVEAGIEGSPKRWIGRR